MRLSGDPAQAQAVDAVAANSLNHSGKRLTEAVKDLKSELSDLKTELKGSAAKNEELEQYSRRNNVIISGLPEGPESTESQVCNFLNRILESPNLPAEVDRTHRLFRKKKRQ